jgi:class 3 adenylate cyclase
MSVHLAAVRAAGAQPSACPVYRSIVAVDLEGSTKRTNTVKGELRRVMYALLDQALRAAGIGPGHLEDLVDRGDGVLILVRPHDDVPKTMLLGRLMPVLAALLAEHNAQVARPELELRLRAVVHAGEVHYDGRGFYGDDLDVAFRLLDAAAVKRALREATSSPLVLVVSEEISTAIVRHGYVSPGRCGPAVRVRVGERLRRGRVHIPVPADADRPPVLRLVSGQLLPTTPLSIAAAN